MGEDIAQPGGSFKATEGLLEEFGPIRVRDTPISEMGFTGAAVGGAVMGMHPVVEIMFMEFLGVALDQVVTEAAKFRYLSNGRISVPLILRATVGAGLGFGCQHSQTLENWLAATPGLSVVVPSDPQTAYSLLRAAVRDPDPVVVLGTARPVRVAGRSPNGRRRNRPAAGGTDRQAGHRGHHRGVGRHRAGRARGHEARRRKRGGHRPADPVSVGRTDGAGVRSSHRPARRRVRGAEVRRLGA